MICKGIYRHYKGGIYEVIELAINSETLEEMVVYRVLKDNKLWVRPLLMWNEIVEYQGKKVKRFTLID